MPEDEDEEQELTPSEQWVADHSDASASVVTDPNIPRSIWIAF